MSLKAVSEKPLTAPNCLQMVATVPTKTFLTEILLK